jgi:Family of unknown function (DUF6496)
LATQGAIGHPAESKLLYLGEGTMNQFFRRDAVKGVESKKSAISDTKGSVYEGMVFYHGTSVAGANSILKNGIDPDRNKTSLYGRGFYVGGGKHGKEIANLYGRLYGAKGGAGTRLEMRLNVKNPKVFKDIAAYKEFERTARSKFVKVSVPGEPKPDDEERLTQYLKDQGYDAIEVTEAGEYIIFDPEQAVIYSKQPLSKRSDAQIHQALQRLDNKKVAKVMRKFKQGELNSGAKDGPIVSNRKQAIAIALSEAGISRKRDSIGLALERMDAINIKANYDVVVTLHSGDYIGATFAKPIGDSLRDEFGGMLVDMGNYNPFPEQQPTPIKRVSIDVSKLYDIEQVAEAISLHLETLGMRVLRRDDRAMPRSSVVAFSRVDSLRMDVGQGYKQLKNRRGQPCDKTRGWYGLRGACERAKKGADTDSLKVKSAQRLANKIRGSKGMKALPVKGLSLLQGGKASQDKALDKMSLGQLFTEADRVGSKYQSKSDPIDLGVNREAAKILDETGMTALKNKAMGVPTIGQSRPRATVKAPAPLKAASEDKALSLLQGGSSGTQASAGVGKEVMQLIAGKAKTDLIEANAAAIRRKSQAKALTTTKSPARSSEDRINNAPIQMAKKRTTRGRSVDSADEPKRMTDRAFDKLASIDPSDITDLLADVS